MEHGLHGDDPARPLRAGLGLAVLSLLVLERPWIYSSVDVPRVMIGDDLIDALPSASLILLTGSAVLAMAAVALILGWHHRWAAWIVFLVGIWILGVPQGIGGVGHYHHVIWVAAAIAACAPGRALQVASLMVGVAYLFPGLAKLAAGDDWFSGELLRAHLGDQHISGSALLEWTPPAPLLVAMATAAVVFELCFGLAVLTRWRRWAVAVAIGFHLSTGVMMGIWFVPMLLVLPGLAVDRTVERRPAVLEVVPGAVLVLAVLAGLQGIERAWPIAHYPGFDVAPSDEGERMWAVDGTGCRTVGEVLLPDAPAGRQWKVERGRDVAELERLTEQATGRDVRIRVGVTC